MVSCKQGQARTGHQGRMAGGTGYQTYGVEELLIVSRHDGHLFMSCEGFEKIMWCRRCRTKGRWSVTMQVMMGAWMSWRVELGFVRLAAVGRVVRVESRSRESKYLQGGSRAWKRNRRHNRPFPRQPVDSQSLKSKVSQAGKRIPGRKIPGNMCEDD